MDNIVEKVASGLRNMKRKPDAFVFNDCDDVWTWDEKTILDLSVFHIDLITDLILEKDKRVHMGACEEVLFIPVWNVDGLPQERAVDRLAFVQGYLEWKSDEELCKIADEEYRLGLL